MTKKNILSDGIGLLGADGGQRKGVIRGGGGGGGGLYIIHK